jgi:hypothetical protein
MLRSMEAEMAREIKKPAAERKDEHFARHYQIMFSAMTSNHRKS